MTTLYLVETNRVLAERFAAECTMDANMEYDCVAISDMTNDMSQIAANADGIVVCNIACLTSVPVEAIGSMPMYVYATRPADVETADRSPYPSYGLMTQPRQLFHAVKDGRYKMPDAEVVKARTASTPNAHAAATAEPDTGLAQTWTSEQPRPVSRQDTGMAEMTATPPQPEWVQPGATAAPKPETSAVQAWQPQPAPQGHQPTAYAPVAPPNHVPAAGQYTDQTANAAEWHPGSSPWQTQTARPDTFAATSFRDALVQSRADERRRAEEAEKRALEEDISRVQPPAKVVAVTSGKGGVGKTTIATSLAVMLSRMEHGRRPGTLSVCLVDFNIDFGNVMATLAMQKGGPNMSHMASDVRERVAKGQPLEYTKDEIWSFLRVHEPSGLHVLCAPETNIDSVYLEYPVKMPDGSMREVNALSIILDNLRRNGGFDVIVLDTGNSTRDSVYISVKAADYVFVIAEQDVNAAMSVVEFYAAFIPIKDIDMRKFALVINRTRPAKKVGNISPEDVASYLYVNARKAGGPGMELVATVEMSDDVLSVTNLGKSMILDHPDSQFTQAIGKLAKIVHDDGTVIAPKKRGLLSRLFGRGH